MCLVLVVWRVHALYPCLIAANRDEFHARPAAPAHWWPQPSQQPESPQRSRESQQILAGRDLSAGGTWLGLTRSGRFAALTNYRDPAQARKNAPSRGALVTSILESTASTPEVLTHLAQVGTVYNGFNIIFSDGAQLGIYESMRGVGRELGPGIYGLSNHLLDTPWPKVTNAKNQLEATLLDMTDDTRPILALLRDDRAAPDEHLPRTGVSLEWERLLSSAFVRAPDYGTRCSTIIRIDRHKSACFDEWSWDVKGAEVGRVSLTFELV